MYWISRGSGRVESKHNAAERRSVGICADFLKPSCVIALAQMSAQHRSQSLEKKEG